MIDDDECVVHFSSILTLESNK